MTAAKGLRKPRGSAPEAGPCRRISWQDPPFLELCRSTPHAVAIRFAIAGSHWQPSRPRTSLQSDPTGTRPTGYRRHTAQSAVQISRASPPIRARWCPSARLMSMTTCRSPASSNARLVKVRDPQSARPKIATAAMCLLPIVFGPSQVDAIKKAAGRECRARGLPNGAQRGRNSRRAGTVKPESWPTIGCPRKRTGGRPEGEAAVGAIDTYVSRPS